MSYASANDLSVIPLPLWFLIAAILLTQSILIYKDAEKRGENKWLWGLFGLLNCPTNGFIYWFVTRKVWQRFMKKQ